MFRQWLASHKSLVATATSGSVITALVVGFAVVSSGYTAQRLDLGDASVWVPNGEQQVVGRANTEVLELNSVVTANGNDLEIVQQGSTVLVVDHGNSKLDIIDPATSTVRESVPLPPDRAAVHVAGSRVVIHEQGTGEVWILPLRDLANFDAESPSTLSLGADAVADVAPDGTLVAYAPATAQVYRIDAARSDAVDSTAILAGADPAGDFSVTSIGGSWAVLDARARTLYLAGSTVDLTQLVGAGPALERPSASGDSVLVASASGVVAVSLRSGEVSNLLAGDFGSATRPIASGDCRFAAWSTARAWRACDSDAAGAVTLDLEGMAGGTALDFQANGARLVLNDARSGATWAVQRGGELINNWDELITETEDQQQVENDQNDPPEVDAVQKPPIAIDDALGARPGRSTVLPLLLNDYDPNGDVLAIDSVTTIDAGLGRIDLINQRQQVQLTLTGSASGTVRFGYTISDGRGGTATAMVTVTVRAATENSPPEQVRRTNAVVQSAGRVSMQVLGDWVDPDGDAIYLAGASVPAPNEVSFKPNGTVVYSDAGGGVAARTVSLLVSDGTAEGSGTLVVSVREAGEVPIVAEPFVLLAYAGQELAVSPLDHVRGGSGGLRLTSVPAKPGATIVPSYESGTFRFTSSEVRSHYLEYVVSDGDQTAVGLVRIDVASPPDANTTPITIPKTVFVKSLSTERIDVAGTDIDPAGGVLLVTGITNLSSGSGVRAEVLSHRLVRVSLEKPLDDGPVVFNYRVSNGLAEAEGVITVVEIPRLSGLQAPIANDDTITARVGQAIDIPVLANDEHPDGEQLRLVPTLAQDLPVESGLLFASGSVLRYLAPDQPGDVTAVYEVAGPDGQVSSARVRIAVREADAAANNAPVPATVTARVIAGEAVTIPIPLTGIDPDGDSVQLIGQSSNPQKGSVASTGTDSFVFQAGSYSAGTDSFEYTVIDALGERATGIVRIGISPRLEGARNPVANLDEVTVRPGVSVNVEVLANDSDPDGSPLTVTGVIPNDPVTEAEVVGDIVRITPPREPGTYGVIYSIANDFGGTSQNFVRVTVSPTAERAFPVARDTVLSLSDVLDRSTVTVDVLANVFFADGDVRDLGLGVYSGYADVARVTANKRIEVTITDSSQIIPFVVSHPEDGTIRSFAFIWVPGRDDALPQLDRRAEPIVVHSEDTVTIDLNDYVIAVGDKPVRLTDSSTVLATHANGDELVVDDDTLVYTSAEKYFGPASISFEVTDGASASDPDGRRANLVLPITVLPRENQPPVFEGAVLEFEPGQQKELDLLKLTTYPYPDDLDELAYTVLDPLPTGFSQSLSGSVLTITANDNAVKGSTTVMTVGVRDDLASGRAGRIQLSVVPSTRPLLQPAPDSAIAKRGESVTVDVLANDEATNPFPGSALTVLQIRGLDGAAIPPGLTIAPSADKSSITVTVDAAAEPTDVNLQYQVADATNDPDRYVWGAVRVSVQDRPDPVTNLLPASFGDRTVTMRWNPGSFNNSPITNYRVSVTSGGTVISTRECPTTTCDITTPGNGPENAVTVSVIAQNAIGDSDASVSSTSVWSDLIPAAPASVSSSALDHGIHLEWSAVVSPPGGSAVDRYRVVVGGNAADVSPAACSGGTCSWDTPPGWNLPNGVAVSYTVSARNGAFPALSAWNASPPQSETPAGAPLAIAAPVASAVSDTAVAVDWSGSFDANGRPVTAYTAAAFTAATPTCAPDGTITPKGATVISAGTGTSTQFTGLDAESEFSVIVFAFNGIGCTASAVVTAHTPPAVVTSLSTSGPHPNGSAFDFTLDGGTLAGGAALTSSYSLYYRLSGPSVPSTEYGPVALGAFLTAEGQQYGQEVTVAVRACRTFASGPVCQPGYSAEFALGTPVNPAVTGLVFVSDGAAPAESGTFTWTGWPTGSYEAIEFACGAAPGGPFTAADTANPGSCHAVVAPAGTPWLTIRVTANGGERYEIDYNGFDFD